MSKLRTVDTLAIAKKHWMREDELRLMGSAVDVADNVKLYRFEADTTEGPEPDVVHVLTDAAGGAEVVVYPQSGNEIRIAGHVSSLLGRN